MYILRILERALEKINGTSQWVPISWVYWPPDNQDSGKTKKFVKKFVWKFKCILFLQILSLETFRDLKKPLQSIEILAVLVPLDEHTADRKSKGC